MSMMLTTWNTRGCGAWRVALAAFMCAICCAAPSWAAAVWPEFRGPHANGHVKAPGDASPSGLPLTWSDTENVTWKTAIPPYGWSTPVIHGNDIWITTATEDGHDYYAVCVDLDTGKIRYNEHLFHSDSPEPLGNGVNCYASPSCVIEQGRVYVHFGSYGTACLDTATGKPLWKRNDMPCRHYRGPGSSPVLFEDLLVLSFDGADYQYVTALDKNTGKTVWKTDRSTKYTDLDEQGNVTREGDFRKGFSTPIVVDNGAGIPLLISVGSMSAFAYDARSGKEVWNLPQPGHTPAPRPVFDKGLTYIVNGRGPAVLSAVKVDGSGDITATHVAWKTEAGVPTEPSPIIVDGLLYYMSNNGVLTCVEAATGAPVWSERVGGNYVTSPIYADGRLYFGSTQGKTYVTAVGREYKLLATNELPDGFMASPAAAGNALILRTKTHLYRIEDKATTK
jgi:outer membrane protein assembly factor BamB